MFSGADLRHDEAWINSSLINFELSRSWAGEKEIHHILTENFKSINTHKNER